MASSQSLDILYLKTCQVMLLLVIFRDLHPYMFLQNVSDYTCNISRATSKGLELWSRLAISAASLVPRLPLLSDYCWGKSGT